MLQRSKVVTNLISRIHTRIIALFFNENHIRNKHLQILFDILNLPVSSCRQGMLVCTEIKYRHVFWIPNVSNNIIQSEFQMNLSQHATHSSRYEYTICNSKEPWAAEMHCCRGHSLLSIQLWNVVFSQSKDKDVHWALSCPGKYIKLSYIISWKKTVEEFACSVLAILSL